jgi:hypothetical protein
MNSATFNFNKNKELFKSFVAFDTLEKNLLQSKSTKKLKTNHSRANSFKSPSSNKYREVNGLNMFLGIKKASLKKTLKKETDESRSKLSTVKTKTKLKQVADPADIANKVFKESLANSTVQAFKHNVTEIINAPSDPNFQMSKQEVLATMKCIFGFFEKKNIFSKKTQSCQTEPLDYEKYKHEAKKLIINSDLKPPADPLESNLVLLYQKEILLDEILSILNEEDIDLNNLLSITLERVEANFYEPPPGVSLDDGVSLNLEDKMKMPTPKGLMKDDFIKHKLKIDLSKIEGDLSSQRQAPVENQGKLKDILGKAKIKDKQVGNNRKQVLEESSKHSSKPPTEYSELLNLTYTKQQELEGYKHDKKSLVKKEYGGKKEVVKESKEKRSV